MKVDNREQAYVPEAKLRDYLLALNHPVGRAKAAFFRALGYDDENIEQLTADLLGIAQAEEVRVTIQTGFGVRAEGETAPRFVTAYPLAEER